MLIRKATEKDVDSIFDIAISEDEDYWEIEDFDDTVGNKDVIFLVAEKEEKVVGYIIGFIVPTRRIEALLHETRVYPQIRRYGIGKQMVDAFCKEAFDRGVKVISAQVKSEHYTFYVDSCNFEKAGKWIEVVRKK